MRVLVNPSAGGGRVRKLLPEVEAELARHGLEHRIVPTTGLEHGCEEAKAAAAAGEIPVVMSGDGLVGQVGGALAGGGTPIGILPGGRGNDLARVLGIPREVPAAVEILARGEERTIDVGEVNGKHFLCIASAGTDSDANRIANQARLLRGNLVYAYAAIRALIAWRPARFKVTADGEVREFTGYQVAAANSKAYGGGILLAPDAVLDDGMLDVVTTAHMGKLRALANLLKAFDGRHTEIDEVTVTRAREVLLEADRPFAVYADGEHLTELPARVRLLPRALRVIAPPEGEAPASPA
jgi:YegS/Rv2252/BmrU family lipid kinase